MLLNQIAQAQVETVEFSPTAKVWIFISDRQFGNFSESINHRLHEFVHSWKSHGSPVIAKGYILADQIILIIADIERSEVSGCSTDGMIHFIQSIQVDYSFQFFDRESIYYIDLEEKIEKCLLKEIGEKLDNKTKVINPFFKDLEEWRQSFIQPLDESKYKRLL